MNNCVPFKDMVESTLTLGIYKKVPASGRRHVHCIDFQLLDFKGGLLDSKLVSIDAAQT